MKKSCIFYTRYVSFFAEGVSVDLCFGFLMGFFGFFSGDRCGFFPFYLLQSSTD